MADFCAQCSVDMGFPAPGDLADITKFGDQMAGLYCVVLCEGCGPIQVNWRGECISANCYERHSCTCPGAL